MKPVGYLTNHADGLHGENGLFYNYVLANNGLFIHVQSPLIIARVLVAEAEVRGLAPVESALELQHGLIPGHLWELALNHMLANAHQETFMAVTWEGEYRLRLPEQKQSSMNVEYSRLPNTVLELHSHTVKGFFSGTDSRDEQGLGIYGVVGELTKRTEVLFRVGAYGYFNMLRWDQVFQGQLSGAIEPIEEGGDI